MVGIGVSRTSEYSLTALLVVGVAAGSDEMAAAALDKDLRREGWSSQPPTKLAREEDQVEEDVEVEVGCYDLVIVGVRYYTGIVSRGELVVRSSAPRASFALRLAYPAVLQVTHSSPCIV